MAPFDIALAVLVIIGAGVGAWLGAWRQVGNMVASISAIAVPFLLAGRAAHALEGPLGAPWVVTYLFCAISLAAISYVVAKLLFWLPKKLRKKPEKDEGSILETSDRVLGAFVGAGQMAFILWAMVSIVTLLAAPIEARGTKLRFSDATLYKLCKRHNLVGALFSRRLEKVKAALGEAQKTKGRTTNKALGELQKDKRFQAIARDEQLRRSLAAGDVTAIARSPQLLSLISDADALDRLGDVVSAAHRDVGGMLEK